MSINKKTLLIIIGLLVFTIIVIIGYNSFSDNFTPENEYIDQRDIEIIEMMDKLRTERRNDYEPIQRKLSSLEKELNTLDEDYSVRIDSFKKMLSQRYKDQVNERCFLGEKEDVCDELIKNISLSKYSTVHIPEVVVNHVEASEPIKIEKKISNQPPHNYDDPSKLDKWFKSKHSPLNGYGYSFTTYAKKYGVDADFGVCVTWADSQSGKMLTTPNNFGNVGNNDRGDRIGYATPEEGIEAVFKAFTNQYQKDSYLIGHFSNGGRKVVGDHTSKVYASSILNWNRNVLSCMNELKEGNVDEFYKVK